MSAGSAVSQLHAWLAVGGAVVAGLLVVLGLLAAAGVVRGARAKTWLDRAILALLVVLAAAAMVGPLAFIIVGPPPDLLHLLYAVIALAAAPVARVEATRRGSARMGAWVAVGGLVTLGALLRLWGTGG